MKPFPPGQIFQNIQCSVWFSSCKQLESFLKLENDGLALCCNWRKIPVTLDREHANLIPTEHKLFLYYVKFKLKKKSKGRKNMLENKKEAFHTPELR